MKIKITVIHLLFTCCFISGISAEWESLFDGKTLDGWKSVDGPATYSIEDGMIIGKTMPDSVNTFLIREKTYGDFILELEFKIDAGLNSGVQIRSLNEKELHDGRVHGYQYEFDSSPRAWTGGIYDEGRRKWLYTGDYNPDAKSLYNHDGWNTIRVECIGNSIRTWLNGQPVAHIIDDMTAKGFIALQVHGTYGDDDLAGKLSRFRNIRINEDVSEASPNDETYIRNLLLNDVSSAEKFQGWKLLWDGESSEGWSAAGKENFPSGGWVMNEGILSIQESGDDKSRLGGDIVTNKKYSAFELDLEVKVSEGANSGIKYFVTVDDHGPLGLEYQLLDDEHHPDAKQGAAGNRTFASLYDLIPSERFVSYRDVPVKVGDWNHVRIVSMEDGTVQHWLNGFMVLEYQRGNNIYRALVARSKYKDYENFGLASEGHILLQDHSDEVSFRSIKIREL